MSVTGLLGVNLTQSALHQAQHDIAVLTKARAGLFCLCLPAAVFCFAQGEKSAQPGQISKNPGSSEHGLHQPVCAFVSLPSNQRISDPGCLLWLRLQCY
jgi:hypothetical protein